MSVHIEPDETVEDLQLNGLRLIQKRNSFRFGMDSVLLAHFSDIHPRESVADIGTGNGVLVLLLYGRHKGIIMLWISRKKPRILPGKMFP